MSCETCWCIIYQGKVRFYCRPDRNWRQISVWSIRYIVFYLVKSSRYGHWGVHTCVRSNSLSWVELSIITMQPLKLLPSPGVEQIGCRPKIIGLHSVLNHINSRSYYQFADSTDCPVRTASTSTSQFHCPSVITDDFRAANSEKKQVPDNWRELHQKHCTISARLAWPNIAR